MSENNLALILIPDISGFTDFVGSTEIDHSRHIITELLEIIINSDDLNLTVSEIEGDAVLCYRPGELPSYESIIKQCEKTFINFHNHIRRYDSERICRCGACEAAVNLTLKFIVHYGPVEAIEISGHQKLHGYEVILAHRLMKNSIPENEYILFSNKIRIEQSLLSEVTKKRVEIISSETTYDKIGLIQYNYIPLHYLHTYVVEPDPVTIPGLGPDKISLTARVFATVDKIYENFTNFDKRLEWNEDIWEITLRNEKINKAGAMHTCLVGTNSLEIESVGRMENEKRIIYGERLDSFRGLQDIITIYTFEKGKNETLVTVDLDYKVKSLFAKLLKPMVRRMLASQTKKSLAKLKFISEKE